MKNIYALFLLIFLVSCTSNTIFKEPKDLIPKDTMSLLIQEMMVASAAKNTKNVHLERRVNYMPFVYDKFKIDSVRFQNSNFYYLTKIDLYQEIITNAKTTLEHKKNTLTDLKKELDSIRQDSIKQLKKEIINKEKIDTKTGKKKELIVEDKK